MFTARNICNAVVSVNLVKFSCTHVKVGLLYRYQTDFHLSSRFKTIDLLYQLFCQNCCFYLYHEQVFFIIEILRIFSFSIIYMCNKHQRYQLLFFDTLEHKINIQSHILKNVDILNNKMRLSLYIVHQSNIIVVGFFFYTVMYKFIYFFGLDSYFKSHNNNDIVCSFYHHAFHNTIFFFVCIQLTSCEFYYFFFFRDRYFVVRI